MLQINLAANEAIENNYFVRFDDYDSTLGMIDLVRYTGTDIYF